MANIIQRSPIFGRLSRFDPFYDDDWLKNFWTRNFPVEMITATQIKVDITEDDKNYKILAEIPGAKKEDVKVEVDGNRVVISAEVKEEKKEKENEKIICQERYQGSSYRSFILDSDVDESKSQAKYENGILELTLPKKSGAVVSKQLMIS